MIMMWFMRAFIIVLLILNSFLKRARMSHENGIVLRGRVVMLENPQVPANDFFVPGRSFPCRLRHAGVSFLDDAGLVVRAASLKFADSPDASPCDIKMNTGVAAPFWNMDTFWQFSWARIRGGRTYLIDYFQRFPRCYLNVRAAVRRNPESYAYQHYHSQTPLQFVAHDGKERYVKFRLMPKLDERPFDGVPKEEELSNAWFQEAESFEPRSRNYLKDEYRARLEKGPVQYILQAQILEWDSLCDRSVELNAMYPWDEARLPWQPLAEVTISAAMEHHEGNVTIFALNHLPAALRVIPARGYTDVSSMDYLRLSGMWARRARLFSYRLFGQNKPIPDARDDTAETFADQTISTIASDDFYMSASLPQADDPRRRFNRAQELEEQRGAFQFLQGWFRTEAPTSGQPWTPTPGAREVFDIYEPDPKARKPVPMPLPPFIKTMPERQKYSPYVSGRMYKVIAASAVSVVIGLVQTVLLNWRGTRAYKLLLPLGVGRPLSVDHWRKDAEFARQRLNGLNPCWIRRMDKIPANFPVTDALIDGLLDKGKTLKDALREGRLFVCDYAVLKGISVSKGMFVTQPIALFYAGADGQLRPLAIQLYQTPEEGPIFTPKDPPGTWLAVRTYLQSADAQVHEVIEHLLHGHMVVEVFDVAMHRALPLAHPVHQMLAPHLEFTMAVNTSARSKMLAPGGPIDRTMAIGAKGAFELMARGWWELWDFDRHNVPADIKRRGVDDPNILRGYHWRDDALATWDIIQRYVTAMVNHFYPDDAAVKADWELQAFHDELRSPQGGAVRELPGGSKGFANRKTVIEVLTRLIYAASAGHAAGNNGQFDYYGFIPNTPGAMLLPPPRSKTEVWTENRLCKALPRFKAASVQIIMVRLLSRKTEMPLGHFPESFFAGSDDVLPMVTTFRRELNALSQKIAARNKGLAVPYTYLDPEQVACSITA